MEVSKDTKLLGYARIKTDDGQFATAKILSDSTVWLEDGTVFTAPPEQMAHFMRMMEHTEREEQLMAAARGIMHSVSPNEELYVDEWDRRAEKKQAEQAKANGNKENKKQSQTVQNKSNTTKATSNTRTTNPTASNRINTNQRQPATRQYVEPKRPSSQPAVAPKKGEKKKVVVLPLILFTLIVVMSVFFYTKWEDGTIPGMIQNWRFPDSGAHTPITDELQVSDIPEDEIIESEEALEISGTSMREDAKNTVTVMVLDGGKTIEILSPKNM